MPNLGPAISLSAFVPELILSAVGCLVLLLGVAQRESVRRSIPAIAITGIIATIIVIFWRYTNANDVGGGFAFEPLAYFVRLSGLVLGVLLTLAAWAQPRDAERGEFFAMMLFSLTGLLLVAPAANLVLLFVALELVSIPTYVLVTLSRSNLKALEAGTKYFYLGAMSAALMAYGFSFLYGVSGTIAIDAEMASAIQDALAGRSGALPQALAVVGLLTSLAGLLFKVAAVPMHFYIGDVYQGAANAVAGLLGFVPKLAGMIALIKLLALTSVWYNHDEALFWVLWVVAALSMTVGNVLALMQSNVKRMLAYSGIAHSGYMMVALLAGPAAGGGMLGNGIAAILYYSVIYGIANLGAFAILGVLRVRGQACEHVRDIAGLLRREPGLALLMALAMFTLMGLPPTPGFWGKMGLFGSALHVAQHASSGPAGPQATWLTVLVIIGVVNSAIAAAYYLRVAAAVLLHDSDEPAEADQRLEFAGMGAFMCGFLLLVFSFYPNALLNSGTSAALRFEEAPAAITAAAPPPAAESSAR